MHKPVIAVSDIAFSDAQFQRISSLMHGAVGLAFSPTKKTLIQSRLGPRIRKLGLQDFGAYLALLENPQEPGEFQVAVDLLTTNETYFFREPRHYELLQEELPGVANRAALKVWSAASSFGDEAYSTAMVLNDLQLAGKIGADWSVLATDISHRALLSARAGVYPEDRLRAVSAQQLQRYCLQGDGEAQGKILMQERLQSRVQFAQLNLCKPFSGIGRFDVIFLRNVLIYFDLPTKVEVVDRVLATLHVGGLFFIGTAEGRVPCKTRLQPLIPGAFRKLA